MHHRALSERFTKPPRLFRAESYLRETDTTIEAAADAHEARLVPLVALDYGNVLARFRQLKYIRRYLSGSLREAVRSARGVRNNPRPGARSLDERTRRELELYAKSLGVTDVGYTRVDPRYIFKGFRLAFPNAIVFTMEMARAKIRLAPAPPSFVEIFRTYHQLGVVVNKIATFLRSRGFAALAGPAIGGDVHYIPLAIDAGLGYSGKNGLLITPGNGPRVRIAAVFTDIEDLPAPKANTETWVRNYCEGCNNCIKKCPAAAIFQNPQIGEDGWPRFIDYRKCAGPFSNDNGCTLCIKYCPFSFAPYASLRSRHRADGSAKSNKKVAF